MVTESGTACDVGGAGLTGCLQEQNAPTTKHKVTRPASVFNQRIMFCNAGDAEDSSGAILSSRDMQVPHYAGHFFSREATKYSQPSM
jgi:hypothetical protein